MKQRCRRSSEVMRPGQLWGHFDRVVGRSYTHELRSTITILGYAPDLEGLEFEQFRLRVHERHTNGVEHDMIWSPPGDTDGLEAMGYRRIA